MAKRMLVDATHPEETRVAVVSGNRLEEFDFETADKHQLKGNIYLAKVTRVEPSLQAAFVEYGGNRHGFLAFSEIHPDYYRIPVADRQDLMADAEDGTVDDADGENADNGETTDTDQDGNGDIAAANAEVDAVVDVEADDRANGEANADDGLPAEDVPEANADAGIETVGGGDVDDEAPRKPRRSYRSYKIQEVIKRRQIMLVQVSKEERGNKGAALTTYLSLAGRYCVLMPNTPRGGGISRKIANPKDRKRMKTILEDLAVPDGMAVILRTAGLERTKAEMRRDLDYLLRLWDSIRELTLESTAPTVIHEEANLIKRAIRDLYSRDIDEVLVGGDEGYRTAKDFMRMLMPSHAKRVQHYRETIPLFHRYQVETQIDALHSPQIQLKSGGYIVLNPTEALVAIDVNSGKATRERNIEETAYKTNLEAADEIARQLRLRDLAGLVVIDFIDMEDDRHNTNVERRLKDAMKQDRARLQVGRISHFGLLELSRQRLRPSFLETHFVPCHICAGTGIVRTLASSALHVLRMIEEEGIRRRSSQIAVHVATDVGLYILNQKRDALAEIEQRYGLHVLLGRDDELIPPDFRLERLRALEEDRDAPAALPAGEATTDDEAAATAPAAEEDGEERSSRRRRRPRRGRRREDGGKEAAVETEAVGEPASEAEEEPVAAVDDELAAAPDGGDGTTGDAADAADDSAKKRRRRGKRGGRRRSGARTDDGTEAPDALADDAAADGSEPEAEAAVAAEDASPASGDAVPETVETAAEAPPEAQPPEVQLAEDGPAEDRPADEEAPKAKPAAKPRRRSRRKPVAEAPADAEPVETAPAEAVPAEAVPANDVAAEPPPVAEPAEAAPAEAAPAVASGDADSDDAAAPIDRASEPAAIADEARDDADDEKVVAAAAADAAPRTTRKPRRGWWQRLLEG